MEFPYFQLFATFVAGVTFGYFKKNICFVYEMGVDLTCNRFQNHKKKQTMQQTETQIELIALIKTLDGIEAAILRERIITAANEILNNQEQVRESFKGSFISPDLYINTMEKVIALLDKK